VEKGESEKEDYKGYWIIDIWQHGWNIIHGWNYL
jgi:hypothetical protein